MKIHNATKFITLILLVVLTSTIVSASTYKPYANTPIAPATLSTSGSVSADSNSGAAVYSYTIDVPPGTAGMQPSLGLFYNSHAARSHQGIVGSGWSLSESYVYRDAQDTFDYNGDDHFTLILNGQSLKLLYSDGIWHTETESHMHIAYASDMWTVKTKDGTTYKFGNDADSRLESNLYDYSVRWYLSDVTDLHGNKIYYDYMENPYNDDIGVTYLKEIRYNSDQTRRIELGYENRPDVFYQYIDANQVQRARRLKEIKTFVGDNLVKKYVIKYNSPVDTVSLLESIQEFSPDGQKLPATTFEYNIPAKGWQYEGSWQIPKDAYFGGSEDNGARFFDINKDGLIDIVKKNDIGADFVFLNTGTGWQQSTAWDLPPRDFSDDGIDEGLRVVDVNKDGYMDILDVESDCKNCREVWINNKVDRWTEDTSWYIPASCAVQSDHDRYHHDVDMGVRWVDVNADGLVDCVRSTIYDEDEERDTYIHNGHGWSRDSDWQFPEIYFVSDYPDFKDNGVRLVDINGDGLPDIVPNDNSIWVNVGNGWQRSNQWKTPIDLVESDGEDEGARFADVNGDGLVDLVKGEGGTRKTYINTGTGWSYDVNWAIPSDASFVKSGDGQGLGVRMVDVNGDGAVDIVKGESKDSADRITWLNKGVKPYLLTKVKEQLGGTITIDYEHSLDSNLGYALWVVKYISKDQGLQAHMSDATTEWKDCTPNYCPAGYHDGGISCSGSTCTRTCYTKKCSLGWYNVFSDSLLASKKDDSDNHRCSSDGLFDYTPTDEKLCYKFEFISPDKGIIDDSDVSNYDDYGNFDCALATYMEQDGGDEDNPWFRHMTDSCERYSNADWGEDTLFIDMDLDKGDNCDAADNLENDKTIYCVPSDVSCNGLSGNCATGCYNLELEVRLGHCLVEDNLDEENRKDFCTAGDGKDPENPYINYIYYKDVYFYFNVYTTNPVPDQYVNQECTREKTLKTPTTTYTFKEGLFDYEDEEFRGFGYVETLSPTGTKSKQYFHQDDAKKGLPSKSETTDSNNYVYERSENEYTVDEHTGSPSLAYVHDKYYDVLLHSVTNHLYTPSKGTEKTTKQTMQYDDYGNLIQISYEGDTTQDGDEKKEEWVYNHWTDIWHLNKPQRYRLLDNSGILRETNYVYETNGDLERVTHWHNEGSDPSVRFEHDPFGNIISEINARGYKTSYEYDSTGTFPERSTNPLGHNVAIEYDKGTGNILTETDANGYETEYIYDSHGRLVKKILPYDSESSPTIEYTYDFDGSVPENIIEKRKIKRNWDLSTETSDIYTYYDGFGNVIETKSEGNSGWVTSWYVYDGDSRIKKHSYPHYTEASSYGSPQEVLNWRYDYDTLGRVTHAFDGLYTQRTEYNTWTTMVYDKNNHRTDYLYDAYGNIGEVKEFNSDSSYYKTNYFYDMAGNLKTIRDSQDNEIKYSYDTLGRKIKLEDLDLGIWTYSYDENNNLLLQTDSNGHSNSLGYDALDRLVQRISSDSTTRYVFDEKVIGPVSRVASDVENDHYEYDKRLRNVKTTREIGTESFTITKTYDSMDRVISKTLPNGEEIKYVYDNQGNLKEITGIMNIKYNQFNNPISRYYPNDLETTFTYDTLERLRTIKTQDLQEIEYTIDPTGNIEMIKDNKNNKQQEFGYDALDRLTSVNHNDYSLSYSYDSIGNMLRVEGDINIIYNYGNNPIHSPISIATDGIACTIESDCGTDSWISTDYCSSGNLWNTWRSYTCSNPGTTSAFCSYVDDAKKRHDCEGDCYDGQCQLPVACSKNSDCGTDSWLGSEFCNTDEVWDTWREYTCNDPGNSSASCTYLDTKKKKEDCPGTCVNGECITHQTTCFDSDDYTYPDHLHYKGTTTGYNPEFTKIITVEDHCVTDNHVYESWCMSDDSINGNNFYCEYGCYDGTCRRESLGCSEDDYGVRTDIKGTTTGYDYTGENIITETDYCISGNQIKEWSCTDDHKVIGASIDCPFGCANGVCKPVLSCTDSTDCPEPFWDGEPFCSQWFVAQTYISYRCENSKCQRVTFVNKYKEECEYQCLEGVCIDEIKCNQDSDCDDNNPSTLDICKNPGLPESYCESTSSGTADLAAWRPEFIQTTEENNALYDVYKFMISNIGDARAEDFTWSKTVNNVEKKGTATLNPGEKLVLYETIPSNTHPSYTFVADVYQDITESSESNNFVTGNLMLRI
ncbi:VCBS repeat-containing protein [Candidatus Woesearchaeota archaeon]|nr:VCBS repeat-containing protein [Candidatus Woesearchaeota archaeon]